MTMRAIGPFNGTLPEPTGMIVGFMRDPSTFPYLTYTQLVPAPDIQFMYAKINSDDPARLTDLNKFAWGYDDYRPTGKGFAVQAEWLHDRTQRWDFPYTIGNETLRIWGKAGINVRGLYDEVRAGHLALHRASRAVSALTSATWTGATNTVAGLVSAGAYWDKSTGQDLSSADAPLPNFAVIKKTCNRVKRKIHLASNGAVGRNQMYMVIPPIVAEAISESGEMFEALKQWQTGKELIDLPAGVSKNVEDWNLPPRYAGFWIVVEDTSRVYINQKADGSVADVTVSSQKDYLMNTDTVYFVSRPGGFDGVAGGKSFSTLQLWHHNGEARVEAFSEPKHDLIEGHVVAEDKFVVPTTVAAYQVTDVLST